MKNKNNLMQYKSYHGSAHYSDADRVFYGEAEGDPHRGQEFDEYLKKTGRYEVMKASVQKKLAALRAKEARKRKLLAAAKKAKKGKLSTVTAAINKFVRKGSSTTKKRQPAAKYAKS